jgi:hypothetical protein
VSFSTNDDANECSSVQTCNGDEYETSAPITSADRVCATLTPACVAGTYESISATLVSDRTCTACPSGSFSDTSSLSSANNLQAHYTFDGHWSASATGSHNWATTMSGSSYSVAGAHDTALNFDGNDRITVHANGQVSETNFGISLWFKTSNTNAGGLFCVDTAGHDRHFGIQSDRIYIRTWPHGSQHPGTTGMASNTWHHAVYTVGPSGEKIFVDGTLIHNRGITSSNYNWDNLAYIGWSTDRGYFNGQIDEVKIYDNELDQTEVSNLFSGSCQ